MGISCQLSKRGVETMSKKDLMKRMYYMATFDGGVYRQGNSNARFIINMREENKDYLEYVGATIKALGVGWTVKERKDYNSDGYTRKPQLRLESKNHPLMSKIRDRLYPHGRKILDKHVLKMMDAEALAIIFMADGCVKEEKRFKTPHAYVELSTKGFTQIENEALSKAIYEATGVQSNLRRHGKYWYLGIPKKSHKLFYDVVKPHVTPSFMYKLERLAPTL